MGGSGLITNNKEYQEFAAIINDQTGGTFTNAMINLLFTGQSIVIDGESYSVQPSATGVGYVFFKNEDEQTQDNVEGHVLINSNGSTDAQNAQNGTTIIDAVNSID
jgi:hypothetical protein